jgi:hypothetical protein
MQVPPWTRNRRTRALADAYADAAAQLGYTVRTEARGGGSDANWLWERWARRRLVPSFVWAGCFD